MKEEERMSKFDNEKAYAQKEKDVFFGDGREIELLHFLYNHPSIASIRGSPSRVLEAVDEFARLKYLMNVGVDKGKIVVDLIERIKPKVMVELGAYIGYSAILFGDAARRAGGKEYYSLERDAGFAAVALSLVELAGLRDFVRVIVGPSAESIGRLHAERRLKEHIDLIFLDHYKPAYVTDLKLCEELRLVRPGTVLAADNVIIPGNPPYLKYVRSTVQEKQKKYDEGPADNSSNGGGGGGGGGGEEGGVKAEDFASGVKNQYANTVKTEKLDTEVKGNPRLVYESEMVHSFEPTGEADAIEITRCIGEN